MRALKTLCLTVFSFSVFSQVLFCAPSHFESDSKKTSLLELYSSEGCSSCPPAETWISAQKTAPGLWKDFIPVVFHVDYWDRLGWPDRFASRAYTHRQQDYAEFWGESTVYTPGFVLNGKAWSKWRSSGTVPPPGIEDAGRLSLDVDGSRFEVHYDLAQDSGLEVHAVVLVFDARTDVKRGENSGKVLTHDFTVLAYERKVLKEGSAVLNLNPKVEDSGRRGAAVWISLKDDPSPLQAVGGYLES